MLISNTSLIGILIDLDNSIIIFSIFEYDHMWMGILIFSSTFLCKLNIPSLSELPNILWPELLINLWIHEPVGSK